MLEQIVLPRNGKNLINSQQTYHEASDKKEQDTGRGNMRAGELFIKDLCA